MSDHPPQQVQVHVPDGQIRRELRHAILFAAALFLIYQLASPVSALLLLFLLAVILAAVLNPAVVFLKRKGLPRALAAVLLVLLGLALVTGLSWIVLPPLIGEVGQLARNLQEEPLEVDGLYRSLEQRFPGLEGRLPPPDQLMEQFAPDWSSIVGGLTGQLLNVAVGLGSLLVLLVSVLFILVSPEPLVRGLLAATARPYRARVAAVLRRSSERLKKWAFGSATVGVVVGLITWLGLHLLGAPHPFLFAVLAGVAELVPTLGPIVAAIPAILMALTVEPELALWVALFYLAVQQLEGNVLSPRILGEVLSVHPVSVIFVILVMHSLYGLLGALIAVPVAGVVKVAWEELYLRNGEQDDAELDRMVRDIAEPGASDEERPGAAEAPEEAPDP